MDPGGCPECSEGSEAKSGQSLTPLWYHPNHSPQSPKLACTSLLICIVIVITIVTIIITTTGSIH